MAEKGKDREKDKAVVLTTRDVVLLFVFFIVVLMIVFTIGLMVGKGFSEPVPEVAENTSARVTPSAGHTQTAAVQEMTLPPAGQPEAHAEGPTPSPTQEETKSVTYNTGFDPDARKDAASGREASGKAPAARKEEVASREKTEKSAASRDARELKNEERRDVSTRKETSAKKETPARKEAASAGSPKKEPANWKEAPSASRADPKEAARATRAAQAEVAKSTPAGKKTTEKAPEKPAVETRRAEAEKSRTKEESRRTEPGVSYSVQTLATTSLEEAQQQQRKLQAKGFSTFIVKPAADSKDKRYRVRAGLFRDRTNAQALAVKLEREGFKPYVAKVTE